MRAVSPFSHPIIVFQSSQLRNVFALLCYVCWGAELAFLRAKLAFWGGGRRAEKLSVVCICLWACTLPLCPLSSFPVFSQFGGLSRSCHGICLSFLCSSALMPLFPGRKSVTLESLVLLNMERKCESAPPTCTMQFGIYYLCPDMIFPNSFH